MLSATLELAHLFILITLFQLRVYISSWNSIHYPDILTPKIAVSIIADTMNYYHTFRDEIICT